MIGGSAEGDEGLEELAASAAALAAFGIGEDQALFDPSVVRGLEYYTGAVFEAELLAETADDGGEPVRFGSIGGGGRYDDLVARFTGERAPATGFSFGVSRLAAALAASGRAGEAETRGPVVVIAFDQARMGDYFALAAELRAAGIAAEVYLGASGMRAQMRYADRRLSPAAVILGGDEIAAGQVTVKDLDLGRAAGGRRDRPCRVREERPGQVTAPRAELVATVRAIVERAAMRIEPPVPAEVLAAVRAPFAALGATAIDPPVIQPLDLILDLAGEAMRERLFLVQADDGAEAALRPDFTIPAARLHIESGGAGGRYFYEGKAFRAAPRGREAYEEFLQIGLEAFEARRRAGGRRRDRRPGLARRRRGRARRPDAASGRRRPLRRLRRHPGAGRAAGGADQARVRQPAPPARAAGRRRSCACGRIQRRCGSRTCSPGCRRPRRRRCWRTSGRWPASSRSAAARRRRSCTGWPSGRRWRTRRALRPSRRR